MYVPLSPFTSLSPLPYFLVSPFLFNLFLFILFISFYFICFFLLFSMQLCSFYATARVWCNLPSSLLLRVSSSPLHPPSLASLALIYHFYFYFLFLFLGLHNKISHLTMTMFSTSINCQLLLSIDSNSPWEPPLFSVLWYVFFAPLSLSLSPPLSFLPFPSTRIHTGWVKRR
jgi:hypothetical protein